MDLDIIDNYDYSHTVRYTPIQQVGPHVVVQKWTTHVVIVQWPPSLAQRKKQKKLARVSRSHGSLTPAVQWELESSNAVFLVSLLIVCHWFLFCGRERYWCSSIQLTLSFRTLPVEEERWQTFPDSTAELTAVRAATVLKCWGCGVLPVSKLLVSKELECKPEQGQKKSLGDAALVPSRQMMKLLPF